MNNREPFLRREKRNDLSDEIHTWFVAVAVFALIVLPLVFLLEWLT